MFIAGLVLDPVTNAPIVVLKDESQQKCLPIWIGVNEATAITSALREVSMARPMTHDLLHDVIDAVGGKVVKISIHDLSENTFFANIEVVVGEAVKVIDSRPSDAIALAVRASAPITVSMQVLEAAQVSIQSEDDEQVLSEEELEHQQDARENPDKNFAIMDKEEWATILEGMEPDDFKYKM